MANNEDENLAGDGAPAADIPDLKKKEKERKKAGAGWGGAKPGGGSFSGATGGTVARSAASAASSMGGAAGVAGAAEAAGAGWLSTLIASLTATALGQAILAAGVLMFLVGAGALAYAMLGGGASVAGGAGGDLGAIASSMKVRAAGGDRTGVASNGEIMFDPLKAAEAAKAPAEKAPADKTAGDAVPPAADAKGALGDKAGWNRSGFGLDHNMSGSKLSSSLGGGFGGKNIFSGGGSGSGPKLNDSIGKVNIKGAQKGSLSASRNARTGRAMTGKSGKQAKSSKAFGQLIANKGMSTVGAGANSAEGARSAATTAFEGSPGAGSIAGGPPTGTGVPTGTGTGGSPPGGGAPDVTIPPVDIPTGIVGDPDIFNAINGIGAMAKKAGEMKKKAAQLMIAGIALIAVGVALMCSGWPWCLAIGAVLMGIGAMLVGMSIMMSQMAEQMKQMADQMSSQLAQTTGNINKDATNKYCIEKAYKDGVDPKNCNPPDSVTQADDFKAYEAETIKAHQDKIKETSHVEVSDGPVPP